MKDRKRPYMPENVKRAVIVRNMRNPDHLGKLVCEETGEELTEANILAGHLHIDHVPPLALRYRDDEGKYHPDANDIGHLEVCSAVGHIHRTSKRRGLYRGDQTEIARSRKIRLSSSAHKKLMRSKAGLEPAVTPEQLAGALADVHKRRWPSRPIQSRPFPEKAK